MAVRVPNGSLIHLSSGFGSDISVTALSNANPGVATAASHGLLLNDIIVVSSGWSQLNERVARVASPLAGTFALEGYDTSSTSKYPTGGGAGAVKKVSGWTQLTQVTDSQSSGGEQQFVQYQFLEDSLQKQLPTIKSAQSLKFTIADDPTLAGFLLCETADDDRAPRVMRLTLPNGSLIFYYVYVTLSPTPSLSVNNLMTREVTMSMLSLPKRY